MLLDRLASFVNALSEIPDLGFKHMPPSLTDSAKASYLLSAASIDEQGNADRIHQLHREVWDKMGTELVSPTEATFSRLRDLVHELYSRTPPGRWIGIETASKCITSAVNYAVRAGDMIRHAAQFHKPKEMVEDIVTHVYRMGVTPGSAQKKVWMYMRWMVRPEPDLHLFSNFDPADLFLPLDSNVGRALDLIARRSPGDQDLTKLPREKSGKIKKNWKCVEVATNFARRLLPNDPARMDYALFLLGRSRAGSPGESCRVVLSECALGELLDCNCSLRGGVDFRLRRLTFTGS